jgi:membrane-associated protease RseP (regulator of RpoE activity)
MRTRWLASLLALCCLAPPSWADEAKKPDPKSYQVPFTLSPFKHVIVRAKINGKGPYHFILDTGAPAMFFATKKAKALGIEPDKNGWGTFDRVEIEGGVVLEKARGMIEDPFQLEGMNGLGLAGVELSGVIGYNVLAHYRMELDFSKNKMTWTPLNWDPPDFLRRGFLGVELADEDKEVVIKTVMPKGPADEAGLKSGDRILKVEDESIRNVGELQRLIGEQRPGQKVVVVVKRNGKEEKHTVTLGERPRGNAGGGAGGLEMIGQVMKFLGSLLGKREPSELVPRGFLGIEVENDDKGMAVIKSVLPKGPAAEAGLKSGDRIMEVDGRTTRGSDDVYRLAGKHRPGEKVTVTVERQGKEQEITVKMGEGL